eukprot:TRINITY_DN4239_c0_g1_i1.p1 TRINITY_DN4239_c0_g1~~TRINITY_DN4239_c0_g1_i1.p1  ORF type:complete len:569 (-),score=83.60 TRINITY_DN4239_c0_g1_i1:177-1883(-)
MSTNDAEKISAQQLSLLSFLKNQTASSAFERFLNQTNDSDQLTFILDVEEFRLLSDPEEVRSRAFAIYQKYFAGQKPKLASEETISAIKCKITTYSPTISCAPPRDLFDEVEKSRISYLESEWFQRFLASDHYKALHKNSKSPSSSSRINKSSYLDKLIRRSNSSDANPPLADSLDIKSLKKKEKKEFRNSKDISRENSADSPKKSLNYSPKSVSASELQTLKTANDASQKMTAAFEEILLEPSFTIIKILCDAEANKTCRDELFTSVVNLFVHNDLIVSLLKLQFRHEIQQASTTAHPDPSTLFRGESAAIKLMSRYFALEGKGYLHKFVRPLVAKICQSGSLEVNKQKVDLSEDVMANSTKLLAITQEFLDNFCQAPIQCPLKFRHVFTTVKRELKNYFPNLVDAIVGSLLFLRFICPAITCPQKYGIEEPNLDKLECQRSLILVSKLLQNLVNGVEFDGTKEAYMTILNCFNDPKNTDSLQNFFKIVSDEELLANAEKQAPQQGNPRSLKTVEACLSSIRNFMIDHKDLLWDQMSQRPALMSKFKNLVFFGLCQIDFVGYSPNRQ